MTLGKKTLRKKVIIFGIIILLLAVVLYNKVYKLHSAENYVRSFAHDKVFFETVVNNASKMKIEKGKTISFEDNKKMLELGMKRNILNRYRIDDIYITRQDDMEVEFVIYDMFSYYEYSSIRYAPDGYEALKDNVEYDENTQKSVRKTDRYVEDIYDLGDNWFFSQQHWY